jgi:hypothetical protein
VTEREAIAIARATAEAEGGMDGAGVSLTFGEPWLGKRGKWEIFSNALGLGAKVRLVIAPKLVLLEKGYVRSSLVAGDSATVTREADQRRTTVKADVGPRSLRSVRTTQLDASRRWTDEGRPVPWPTCQCVQPLLARD